MSGATIKVALVGLGYWGPNLLRVLSDMEDVEVAWLCDRDEERLRQHSRRAPEALRTTAFEDVLGDWAVDAVCIATPVGTHFDLARQALAADKHVFVEKPLAASSTQAEELLAQSDRAGRVLMCGHTFLYSPSVRAVKDMLRAAQLGEVFFISSSRVNLGLHQRDVSVVWDLAPHDFSILLYWLEEMPVHVRATGRDSIVPGIPDVAFVTLAFPSGIIANVELSWLAPSKLRRTVLVGAEKMVVYDDGATEPVRVHDSGVVYRDPETFGEYYLAYRTGDIVSPRVPAYEPLSRQLENFVGAMQRGEPLVATSQLACDVVSLVEAADQSLHSEGREVSPHQVKRSGGRFTSTQRGPMKAALRQAS